MPFILFMRFMFRFFLYSIFSFPLSRFPAYNTPLFALDQVLHPRLAVRVEHKHSSREHIMTIPRDHDQTLQCPNCNAQVDVKASELAIGNRVGCLHCGYASRLAPEPDPDGMGRHWLLEPME